jgi:hypothetical protein
MSSVRIRGLAALALGFLVVGTAPRAAAQCVGVTALGRVNSVSGNPFQAEVNTVFPQSLEPKATIVARDGQGRVRVDQPMGRFKVTPPSGQETQVDLHSIEICDPVSRQTITLNTLNKTAVVQHWPPLKLQRARPMSEVTRSFCEVELHMGANLPNVEPVDLGHKTFAGVDTHGVLERRTNSERQLWCSDELEAMVLLVMDTDAKKEVFHFAMTNIQRGEPAAEMFAIPADYKVVERANTKAPE